MRASTRWIRSLLPCVSFLLLAPGCGGGGETTPDDRNPTGVGRLEVTVEWPGRVRLIPAAANAIQLNLSRDAQTVTTQTLARPAGGGASTAAMENLGVGGYLLAASAHPNADGTGTAQAGGAVNVTVEDGQTTKVTLTLASTIDRVEISPAVTALPVGTTVGLTATARNALGEVVLTWPGKLQWSSADTGYATVDTNGVVTGVKPTGKTPGTLSLSVTETESGKSASLSLAVTSNTSVTVSPSPTTLTVGETRTFTATVSNAPVTGVTWSLAEGATGGTVSAGGVYTAATRGTYHVVATSVYDNGKEASATATVQAGGLDITIQ
ncbi:MAG: Ig-like domain-containing protein [Armatimonadetes bacterium]|nr:Ig-like domain-containing protein [Armatimonadota bacterium]